MTEGEQSGGVRVIGRYALYGDIASGGMATVHFGRLLGPAGFSRTVAIKRLHPQYAKDPEFVSMFLDEARLAARIRHPNVVSTLDVVATQGELFLVMDYVQGESIARLLRTMRETKQLVPPRIAATIIAGALQGLHAAHEARNERGEPLHLVHRDISPQNILVGTDGVPRVLDFGVAKAAGRIQTTREGQLKGKLAYMAPEQINGEVSRQTDIYAAGVVLWETLTAKRLFAGDNEGQVLQKVISGNVTPPSEVEKRVPADFDAILARALAKDPRERFTTAREMAIAVERALGVASSTEVGEWVEHSAHQTLALRANRIAEIESSSGITDANLLHGLTQVAEPPSQTSQPEPPSQSSQLSSISLSREASPRKRSAWITWAIPAAAIVILLGALVVVRIVKTPAEATPLPSASITHEEPTPIATATEPPHKAQPVVTTEAPPPASSTAKPAIKRPTVVTKPTATAPAQNCTPPYTLDDQGHKIWKKECL